MDSDVMSIASSVTNRGLSQIQSAVQTKMLKQTMDTQEQKTQDILSALPTANPPHLGQNIDFKV